MAQRTRMKLDIANPNAAGIDVGSAGHFVAVPPARDDEAVRKFTCASYVDQGQEYYEERYRQRVLFHLKKKAAAMGLQLVPVQSQQT